MEVFTAEADQFHSSARETKTHCQIGMKTNMLTAIVSTVLKLPNGARFFTVQQSQNKICILAIK